MTLINHPDFRQSYCSEGLALPTRFTGGTLRANARMTGQPLEDPSPRLPRPHSLHFTTLVPAGAEW